jgi:hypothetical protein
MFYSKPYDLHHVLAGINQMRAQSERTATTRRSFWGLKFQIVHSRAILIRPEINISLSFYRR